MIHSDAVAVPEAKITEKASTSIPWYLWCSIFAVSSAMIGIHWDISWHMSIGRDTFWTPAHVAIYLCGVLSGISCGYLILTTTFGKSSSAEGSVNVLGLRGPFGAFLASWGGAAMLVSAPFDNWWHNAYGLDVKILSPPHTLLITGIIAVEFGTLLMILSKIHGASESMKKKLSWLYLYIGAAILTLLMVMIFEQTSRVLMHSAFFYRVICLAAPGAMVAICRASDDWGAGLRARHAQELAGRDARPPEKDLIGRRWAYSILAGFYMAFWMMMMLILPLQPAEPKLGPVYQKVTHLIPMGFPMLLIVPGVVLDLVSQKIRSQKKWVLSVVYGFAFVASFFCAQWLFADFLMSPASRNAIFGTHYFAYVQPPDDYEVQNIFFYMEHSALEFWRGMLIALLSAIVMSRLGIALGDWMRKIRR